MPIPAEKPKPFERALVEARRTGVLSCSGLFRQDRLVNIGRGDIRSACSRISTTARRSSTTDRHWVAVQTADHDALERKLVLASDPVCPDPERRQFPDLIRQWRYSWQPA